MCLGDPSEVPSAAAALVVGGEGALGERCAMTQRDCLALVLPSWGEPCDGGGRAGDLGAHPQEQAHLACMEVRYCFKIFSQLSPKCLFIENT